MGGDARRWVRRDYAVRRKLRKCEFGIVVVLRWGGVIWKVREMLELQQGVDGDMRTLVMRVVNERVVDISLMGTGPCLSLTQGGYIMAGAGASDNLTVLVTHPRAI